MCIESRSQYERVHRESSNHNIIDVFWLNKNNELCMHVSLETDSGRRKL